ncbi:cap-specific mRNA (nucleoside-2'-O-)-methyltransferase 1-like [Tubulanus polymorphus]|uniref:cap-specific mRNA (nucleoside-2'-O-)-methyltransferase 1-like n=1 Tax=Tubulanus polymorphus TaxID=672921 RepID=UPI003DA36327
MNSGDSDVEEYVGFGAATSKTFLAGTSSLSDSSDESDDGLKILNVKDNADKASSVKHNHVEMGNSSTRQQSTESSEDDEQSDDGEPSPKKKKIDKSNYNQFAFKMMAKMGHKEGTGLGRRGQGRVDIVEASKQRGRRGLGLAIKGFEAKETEWDFESEKVSEDEIIEWIPSATMPIPDIETLREWMKEGPKKLSIDDETNFISEETLESVLKCKSVFDNLEGDEMRRARTRSNPYETIRGGIFQNRAAMKMANMDAISDFMFTDPKDKDGMSSVEKGELLYFADICAGPGGFSEYVLWRRQCTAKGFGMTLRGPCDFKLEEFHAAPSELFEPFYGAKGVEGDGDIYNPANLIAFRKFVMENTDDKGVHFVMADGGFSVEGHENIQEILSKRLYLCQFLCALSILREGGHFVCKLFDIFTSFSVGLIYLMYLIFEHVAIFKPVTSRPANSERYIVCKWLKPDADGVHDYLFEANISMDSLKHSENDVEELVPLHILQMDHPFIEYINNSNEELGIIQATNLQKIQAFAQNPNLYEGRQADMRQRCFKKWKVPDEVRAEKTKDDPKTKFQKLLKDEVNHRYMSEPAEILTTGCLKKIKSVYDYRCVVCGSENISYFLGMGRSYVFRWNGVPGSKWMKFDDVKLEIPRDTLLEVEIVQELFGEGKGQKKVSCIHVLDALVLFGEDLRHLHFTARIEKIQKFIKAVNKASRPDLAPLRCKDVYRLEDAAKIFDRVANKIVKGRGHLPRECYISLTGRHYLPQSILLIGTVKAPWHMQMSRSRLRKYFYNEKTHQSTEETPQDCIASYKDGKQSRFCWRWVTDEEAKSSDLLRTDFLQYVGDNTVKLR